MTKNTITNTPSLYDAIPNLDSWYECKNLRLNEVVPCIAIAKKRKANTSPNCVSFSSAPPAVFHYQEKTESFERPVQYRRNSSSESVKVLLKHYTSKLSRRINSKS